MTSTASVRKALRLPPTRTAPTRTVNLVIRHGAGRTVVSAVVAASLVSAVVALILHRRGGRRSPVALAFEDPPEPLGTLPCDGGSPDDTGGPAVSRG